MAQIPDWTSLPSATPQPSYRRVTVDDSAAGVDEAVAGFGRTLQQVGDQGWQQQQQLLDAKAQNAVEQHELAVQTAAQGLREDVVTGKVPYDQAQGQLNQLMQKIPQPDFSDLRPAVATLLQGRIQRNIAQAQFGMDNVVDAARKDDFKAQFGQGLDTLGKLAGMPGADIDDINARADVYRPLARNAGLPAAFIDKAIQDFKDQNWFNQATQRSMEAKDNLPALKQMQHDLVDENGFYAGKLDTDKRNILLRSVINSTDAVENRIEREQEKAEIHGQMALSHIDQQIASGVPATPQLWSTWADAVKGTSAEPEFNQRLEEEQTVQNVLREPIDQQQAFVQQRQQELDQHGGSVHDVLMVHRLASAVNANTNLMKTEPLIYEARRNGADLTPLDLSQMGTPAGNASIYGQINDRVATLTSMRKQYGPAVPLAPLLPQEAAQLTSQLQNATPQDRTLLLTSLHSAFNNDDAYMAAMRQIAPKSPVTAIAGSMLPPTTGAPDWYDPKYAPQMQDIERVFRGEGLLNAAAAGGKGSKSMPSEESVDIGGSVKNFILGKDHVEGLREQFANEAGNLFADRPQLGEAHYEMFKDAVASLLAEKGAMGGDLNLDIRTRALKIALGNTIDYNGNKVAVPPGMDPSMFKGIVDNAVDAAARAQGRDDWRDRMSGFGLHQLGGLQSPIYQLTMGNAYITLPDGKTPFTIDLRNAGKPAPPRPAASPDEAAALAGPD